MIPRTLTLDELIELLVEQRRFRAGAYLAPVYVDVGFVVVAITGLRAESDRLHLESLVEIDDENTASTVRH
jgi:hypothetical protein